MLGPAKRSSVVDAIADAEVGPRCHQHPDRLERAGSDGVMEGRRVGMKSARAVGVEIDAQRDQPGQGLSLPVESQYKRRL